MAPRVVYTGDFVDFLSYARGTSNGTSLVLFVSIADGLPLSTQQGVIVQASRDV
jgi:hypothetical protein